MATKIVPGDIYPISVSFSRFQNLNFSTTLELQQNFSATGYAVGLSSGMTNTAPLQIHENVTGTSSAWFDEGSWAAIGVSVTTVIPWPAVSGTAMIMSTTNATIADGDVIGIFGPGVWSSSGNANVSRFAAALAGNQFAAIITEGFNVGGTGQLSITELFNGSTWTIGNNSSLSRLGLNGIGSQNATLNCNGSASAIGFTSTETFNGSNWAASSNTNLSIWYCGAVGSPLATVRAGGTLGGAIYNAFVEYFNGSVWTISNNLNNSRSQPAAAGTQNAALISGGILGALNWASTEILNGSTWTFSGNLTQTRGYLASGGTQSSAFAAGGFSAGTSLSSSELFNGSVWYSSGIMPSPMTFTEGCGTQASGMVTCGTQASGGAGTIFTFLHNQNTYAKVTYNNIKEARNVGVAFNSGTTISNVVYNGYIGGLSITTSNIAITAATAPGTFAVISRYAPNVLNTNMASCIYTQYPFAEDFVVGSNISLTQMYVYGNSLNGYETILRW